MSPDPIPVGVVGAGNMGANHVRVYNELPGSEIVEVVETDTENAAAIRDQYDVDILSDVSEIERAEAVTVAVPNRLHREVAIECIEAGLGVLVEKPLALTVDDAQAIVDAAEDHDAILQVGHIERFNPAVQTLKEILENQEIIAIEAHRLGPFNEQLSQESVIFDLMIHDLDIIDSLVSESIEDMVCYGSKARSSETDHAICVLKYSDNTIGTATASHVTHGKIRELHIITIDSFIQMNYQEQDITVQRRGTEETTTFLSRSGYRTETITESPFIQTKEPLSIELEHFVFSIREGVTPLVDGKTGLKAVRLAANALEQLSIHNHPEN